MTKQDRLKTISVRELGSLALPDFCPRCFWFERHTDPTRFPFPGIFNTLDSVSKKSVYRSFLQRGVKPDWLPVSDVVDVVKGSLHFHYVDKTSGWTLIGEPDSIFKLKDRTYHIVDYKTAKFTETQDKLFPLYEVQLNGYAFLAPLREIEPIKPISKLSLVYCEPNSELHNDTDFTLGFTTKPLNVELKTELIPQLLKKAREIVDQKTPPPARQDCTGICSWIERILEKQ